MANEPSGSSITRGYRLIAGAAILALVLAVAVWYFGFRAGGPDLGEKLVDGEELRSCLIETTSPIEDWHLKAERAQEVSGGAAPTMVEIETGFASLSVYPSVAAAEELDSRVSFDGENYAGEKPQAKHWANVLVTNYNEDKIPDVVNDAIYECVERAAIIEAGSAERFQDCDEVGNRGDLVVRGESCDEALSRLPQGFPSKCDRLGPGFACGSEYLCCMSSAVYVGNGDIELIFNH